MKRVLITGANGHLGANTVRSLLKRDFEVVPFVRHTSDLRGLSDLGLEYKYGDVMDGASLTEAAQGCDAIIHSAAVFRMWAKDPAEIMEPAMVGARNIFSAAKDAGIKRVVYTSSVASVGLSDDPQTLLTSADWNEDPNLAYVVAKTRSEQEAWRLADEYQIPMIALCPGTMLGPHDYRLTPSTEMIRDYVNGTGQTFNSGLSYVDVRDVADVHALAIDQGQPGKRYIVTAHNLLMKEMGELVTQLTGAKVGHFGGSRNVALMVARLIEFFAKFTGSPPSLTRDLVLDFGERYQAYDFKETWDAFGLQPNGIEETVKDCIRWLVQIGEIKPKVVQNLSAELQSDLALQT